MLLLFSIILRTETMDYWDFYVLATRRDSDEIENFIRTFIPEAHDSFDGNEFLLKTYEGDFESQNISELIRAACHYKKSEGGFRIFGGSKLNPIGGWLYFNSDGSLIYGLTAKDKSCDKLMKKLKIFADSKYGYIAGDCPPETSEEEFIECCK